MNFEFLEKLNGINNIYKYCKNAEELALSKPDCSMFSARKSGEALARYIYFTAHKVEVENLDFNSLLKDTIVKKYINNREVINAFHYIRKNGNSAVHCVWQDKIQANGK